MYLKCVLLRTQALKYSKTYFKLFSWLLKLQHRAECHERTNAEEEK